MLLDDLLRLGQTVKESTDLSLEVRNKVELRLVFGQELSLHGPCSFLKVGFVGIVHPPDASLEVVYLRF